MSTVFQEKKVLRLGQINFINCLPINYALSKFTDHNFSIQSYDSVPSTLNLKLRAGELDLAPISSFEYLKNKSLYELLDGLSISSKRNADSVLLYIQGAIGDLFMAKKIYVTDKSATSVNLLKIILIKKYGYNYRDGCFYNSKGDIVEFIPFNSTSDQMPIKLLIGDEALKQNSELGREGSNFNVEHIIIDLGMEWYLMSNGLPMVFGLWALNKNSQLDKQELCEFFTSLMKKGLNDYLPDVIIEAYKQTGLAKSILVQYFQNLNYDLSDKHLASLELFDKYLRELELI